MHATTKARGLNIGAIIATLIAAAFIGIFALMLMGRDGSTGSNTVVNEPALPQQARFPEAGDKFAPGRIQPVTLPTFEALCHGEGLMDTQMQEMLIGESSSVAQYCGTVARPAAVPEASESDTDSTGTIFCHGEGLSVPADPAVLDGPPGSYEAYCTPIPEPDDNQTLPHSDGPAYDPRNY